MGLSVAGTAAILISGLLIASTLVFTVIEYRDKIITDAQREQAEYMSFSERSRISITDATIDNIVFINEPGKWLGNITINLKNIGSTTFDLNKLNILVNGSIVSGYIDKNNIVVNGRSTFLLSPNNTAIVPIRNCYFDEPASISTRIAAVMENGITAYYTIVDKTPTADAGLRYRYVEDNETICFDASLSVDNELLFREWYDTLYNVSTDSVGKTGEGIIGYYWDFDDTMDSDGDGNLTNDRDAEGKIVDYIFHARSFVYHYNATNVSKFGWWYSNFSDLDIDGVSDPYTVTLTVKDAKGRIDTKTITVYVSDRTPPKVTKNFLVTNKMGVISNDQLLGDTLTFNASACVSDNVGFVYYYNTTNVSKFGEWYGAEYPYVGVGLYFAWDFNGDGVIDTNFTRYPTAQYIYTKPQCPYNVTLFVKDADNNIFSYTQRINITKLTPEFTFSPKTIWEGDAITFDAAPSDNTFCGVEPLTYTWNFGDGTTTTSTEKTVMYTYDKTLDVDNNVIDNSNAAGNFAVTLTITDAKGNYGSVKHNITIGDKTPPTILQEINHTVALDSITKTASITFLTNTTDNSKYHQEIVCNWSFGDGVSSYYTVVSRDNPNPTMTHTFTIPGEYVVIKTAFDATGNRASSRFVVTVTP
ncbi:MAG: PKD domain-containing protein [Thermoplasmata archaeon]